jgi:ribosome-associated toxin RatA of RatAB toxin-antitoxin module
MVATLLLFGAGHARAGSDPDVRTAQISETGSPIAWGHAVSVVKKPIGQVASVVVDYANYEQFMPYFTKSEVLARRGGRAMAYMEVSVAAGTITLWAQLQLSETSVEGGARVIEAQLVDGNVNTFRASWRLTPVDGGSSTQIDFKMHVDPDLPLPSSLFSRQNEKAAGKTVKALCAHVTGSGHS